MTEHIDLGVELADYRGEPPPPRRQPSIQPTGGYAPGGIVPADFPPGYYVMSSEVTIPDGRTRKPPDVQMSPDWAALKKRLAAQVPLLPPEKDPDVDIDLRDLREQFDQIPINPPGSSTAVSNEDIWRWESNHEHPGMFFGNFEIGRNDD